MKQIQDALFNGKEILKNSIKKYEDLSKSTTDKFTALETIQIITQDEEKNRAFTMAKNKYDKENSYIKYVNFIIKEIDKITKFENCDHPMDFQYNCLYFGNGVLFYNDKFLEYTPEKMFQIILNHIFHYCGALYLMNNNQARLSYVLLSMNVCYGNKLNTKLGKEIYATYNNGEFIIFDISPNYKNFIINNKDLIWRTYDYEGEYIFFIIKIGEQVSLYNLQIISKDKKFSVRFIEKSNIESEAKERLGDKAYIL